ncbi:MAG: hypothetical protein PHR45_02575 [Muribaculaceae bacterium]|nr:hypothetical protein [Muribaculaceae bacterium]
MSQLCFNSVSFLQLGVSEAITLVGGNIAIMWRDEHKKLARNGFSFGNSAQFENYIVWRR